MELNDETVQNPEATGFAVSRVTGQNLFFAFFPNWYPYATRQKVTLRKSDLSRIGLSR